MRARKVPGYKKNNARIQKLEKEIFDLKELFEISKSLNSTLDYTILIDSILLVCMAQLKVLKVGLFIRKYLDSNEFSFHRNYAGFEVDHSKAYTIPDDHPMIELFAREYTCYTLKDIEAKKVSLEKLENIVSLGPSLLVPLQAQGKISGLIIIGERIDAADFDAYEKEYILNVATLASIAINNAVLFEMTTTDMMTKLKLKHYFYAVLDEWLTVAKDGKGFSLLMFDIDFFKNVNDTYGHVAGDTVLKYTAKVIKDSTRSADVVARYGGEEFVVCVAQPGRAMAMKIAERIRKSIENSKIKYNDKTIRITISCGAVCYDPAVDKSGEIMIDRADRALYQSKLNGRNRITIAAPLNGTQNSVEIPVSDFPLEVTP
jgi:diguanylate cyclase (GGDEF)-like protein